MGSQRRHLKLIICEGNPAVNGPITRLGLHSHFEPVPVKQLVVMILAKCLLLASTLYWICG